MKKLLTAICLALVCSACAKSPEQKVHRVDKNVIIELTVRLEVDKQFQESQKAIFTIAAGSEIAEELTLNTPEGKTVTFQNFRLKASRVSFDSWAFSGFMTDYSTKNVKGSLREYKTEQAGGFYLPKDGIHHMDRMISFFDSTSTGGELLELYATLKIETDTQSPYNAFKSVD